VIELDKDFSEFLRLFNSRGVRYLVVGGYAVGYHSRPRATGDLDIWISPLSPNADLVAECLREFGFDGPEVKADLFQGKETIIRMGVEPVRLEIITKIDGVEFEECYPKRVIADVEGTEISFISLPDLITNKRASGRHKDLADLELLEKI
jgi:hypothetical protein